MPHLLLHRLTQCPLTLPPYRLYSSCKRFPLPTPLVDEQLKAFDFGLQRTGGKEMTKITPEAKARCTDPAHNLQDQLAQLYDPLQAGRDQEDVTLSFAADAAWSGQHQRLSRSLTTPKGWDTPEPASEA